MTESSSSGSDQRDPNDLLWNPDQQHGRPRLRSLRSMANAAKRVLRGRRASPEVPAETVEYTHATLSTANGSYKPRAQPEQSPEHRAQMVVEAETLTVRNLVRDGWDTESIVRWGTPSSDTKVNDLNTTLEAGNGLSANLGVLARVAERQTGNDMLVLVAHKQHDSNGDREDDYPTYV